MLGRNIIGYLPATVLAPAAAFIGMIAYSHVLQPDQYGRAVVVLVVVELIQVFWFQWLRLGFLRFWEMSRRDANTASLQATAFVGWASLALVASIAYLVLAALCPMDPMLRVAFYFGLPLLLTKSLLAQCLEWHRVNHEVGRYSLLESMQSATGVALGILLIVAVGLDERAIMIGSALGCGIALAADLRRVLAGLHMTAASRDVLWQLLHYGLPLSLTALLAFIVNSSDRLLLQWFAGTEAVGLYSLAYNLADRTISMVFIIVTLPAFPLAVQALERTGPDATRGQYRQTFAVLAAFALPAVAGLMFVAGPLVGATLGSAFVASAADIIPWIAVASLMAGLKTHYFDHAFMLRHRTYLLLWTVALPAVANIGLNLWWIPRFGAMGAVYSTIAAFALGLALSIAMGRRLFALPLPPDALVRPLAATTLMLVALVLLPLPADRASVFALIAAGMIAYACGAMLFNVLGLRDRALLLAARYRR